MTDVTYHYAELRDVWFALILCVPLLAAFWTFLWGLRRLSASRRRTAYTWMKRTLLLCLIWPLVGGLHGVVQAVRAVTTESTDPSEKARMLAEGISEAMNCTAWMLCQLLVLIPMLLVLRRRLPRDVGPAHQRNP